MQRPEVGEAIEYNHSAKRLQGVVFDYAVTIGAYFVVTNILIATVTVFIYFRFI
jgi:hypothetical protein